MRTAFNPVFVGLILTLGLCGCRANPPQSQADSGELAGEAFLDAFYSWDAQRLTQLLLAEETQSGASAISPEQLASVLYYQGWAAAGNYQIQTRRPCGRVADGRVSCAVTVTDDLGGAMGYVATDTFWLTIDQPGTSGGTADNPAGQIVGVTFSADDPPVFEAALRWMQRSKPGIFTGPCLNMFAGGTTPGACVKAIVAGAKEYMQTLE